ncbi:MULTISPECIES: hypothetical protein [Fischerella]|nr:MULTISPECIES: hypothetical protein [Fischerella]
MSDRSKTAFVTFDGLNGSSAFDIDSTSQVQRSGNKEDSPKP